MVENRPWLTVFSHAVLILGVVVVAFPVYVTFIASTLEPGELAPGLTRAEVLKALEGGKALRAASLVFRFAQ